MGKKEKAPLKVVLDTNILVSALLFRGELSRLVELWKNSKIMPVISKETFRELKAVIEYPKFRLTKDEIRTIIEEELLPFFEVVEVADEVSGICRDPEDDKFISCAISASADFVVSGDKHLCELHVYKSVRIIKAADLMKMFN
jgi:putative PIN family toxin of toxin-antitoxin system